MTDHNEYIKNLYGLAIKEDLEKEMADIQPIDSYQNKYLTDIIKSLHIERKTLEKENKQLRKKCSKFEYERNYYMHRGPVLELFDKYIGVYNIEEKTLFVHHFIDSESIFAYGDAAFDGDYACISVRGSWDNWNKDYILKKKCVRDSDGIYEGYVYYIINENIVPGNEYEFKFKDTDGDWIEPVYDGQTIDDVDCLVDLKQNNSGVWNAVLTVRSHMDVL